jgi:hypothetical protein
VTENDERPTPRRVPRFEQSPVFEVVSRPDRYASDAAGPVRWVEVASGGRTLGYLWAADQEGAAGWVSRSAAGDDGDNAGVDWYGLLRAAKADGLSPFQALASMLSDPGGGVMGRAVPGSGGDLPSLAALRELAAQE